ncbi:MAG TPA: porin [Dongiaceae bacterium]|jgi:hypothetical protein|nr:porin [Dongiaceae bacterium]
MIFRMQKKSPVRERARYRPRNTALVLAGVFSCASVLLAEPCRADEDFQWKRDAFTATLEGWLNATGAAVTKPGRGDNPRGFLDGGLRAIATYKTAAGPTIGARVVGIGDTNTLPTWGDRSIFIQDINHWGRIEGGWRSGLPDALYGYTPNSYTFVSADYGPDSGYALDPNGQLPTRFLNRRTRREIDAISYLGLGAALSTDESPKITYTSPRFHGLQFGASIAPDADDTRRFHFGPSGQMGVVYEYYYGNNNEIRLGASGSVTDGTRGTDDIYSGNIGATFIWNNLYYLGLSATAGDGSGGRTPVPFAERARGGVVSFNYEPGRWAFGGYFQYASTEDERDPRQSRDLAIAQIGASWRYVEQWRIFGAVYYYDLDRARNRLDQDDGAVFLIGTRLIL